MNYVYGVMNKRNTDDMIIISDFSDDLIANYLNKKTQNIDPVIINALNRISPFTWDENLKINSEWTIKKVFDPVTPYNIISGHAFVVHDQNNNLAVLSLYIDKYSMDYIHDHISRHKDELQGLLIQIHEMLLSIYQEEKVVNNILSARESEILYWCTTGKTYTEVADILQITVSTVKFHMAKIVKKMGVKNAKHAISLGTELNMISPPSEKSRGIV